MRIGGALSTIGHNSHERKTSLAEAKAHLSELVDQAEHHKRPTLILRHGKPAAVIVPVQLTTIDAYVDRLLDCATEIATLGPKRAAKVAEVAASLRT